MQPVLLTWRAGHRAGYITRRGIPRGTPLRRTDLLGHITDVGIAGAVRPGFRAMAIPILNKATLHDLVKSRRLR
jgi:Flp pilus assembly protein CpaB